MLDCRIVSPLLSQLQSRSSAKSSGALDEVQHRLNTEGYSHCVIWNDVINLSCQRDAVETATLDGVTPVVNGDCVAQSGRTL